MATEIERKFVLPGRPEQLDGVDSERIEQGYLATGADEVRVRRIGARTLLTVKQGRGQRRTEEEVEISAAAFEALWPLTRDRRVEKLRHRLEHGELTIEVDVYGGALEGLVVAEVEFDSDAASAGFEAPAWLGREVTGDHTYSNQSLALDGRPEDP
jgi:CYTH domain-containing protein